MTIAAITGHYTLKELKAFFPDADIGWLLFATVPAAEECPTAEVVLDLDFNNEPARREALGRLLPALVIVNAVVPTTGEIGYPFVRMNGWPGWPERTIHELAAPDEPTAMRIATLYGRLGHAFRLAPDTPGMISPRILAAIINEAWYTWQDNVSTKEEIDTAMRLGTNYPFGPFEWGERIGLGRIMGLLRSLSRSDPRYTPCRALEEAAGAANASQRP